MAVTGIGSNYNNVYESAVGDKVSDYYSYLSKNYDCVKNGNVAISGSFLRQCANDPEKARYLEENLSLYNELHEKGYESAKQNAQKIGARLVSYSESWSIDSNGNISATTSTTVTTDTGAKSLKEIREDLNERLKEKREKAKKAEKSRTQKEEERERSKKMQKSKPEYAPYSKFDVGV